MPGARPVRSPVLLHGIPRTRPARRADARGRYDILGSSRGPRGETPAPPPPRDSERRAPARCEPGNRAACGSPCTLRAPRETARREAPRGSERRRPREEPSSRAPASRPRPQARRSGGSRGRSCRCALRPPGDPSAPPRDSSRRRRPAGARRRGLRGSSRTPDVRERVLPRARARRCDSSRTRAQLRAGSRAAGDSSCTGRAPPECARRERRGHPTRGTSYSELRASRARGAGDSPDRGAAPEARRRGARRCDDSPCSCGRPSRARRAGDGSRRSVLARGSLPAIRFLAATRDSSRTRATDRGMRARLGTRGT